MGVGGAQARNCLPALQRRRGTPCPGCPQQPPAVLASTIPPGVSLCFWTLSRVGPEHHSLPSPQGPWATGSVKRSSQNLCQPPASCAFPETSIPHTSSFPEPVETLSLAAKPFTEKQVVATSTLLHPAALLVCEHSGPAASRLPRQARRGMASGPSLPPASTWQRAAGSFSVTKITAHPRDPADPSRLHSWGHRTEGWGSGAPGAEGSDRGPGAAGLCDCRDPMVCGPQVELSARSQVLLNFRKVPGVFYLSEFSVSFSIRGPGLLLSSQPRKASPHAGESCPRQKGDQSTDGHSCPVEEHLPFLRLLGTRPLSPPARWTSFFSESKRVKTDGLEL